MLLPKFQVDNLQVNQLPDHLGNQLGSPAASLQVDPVGIPVVNRLVGQVGGRLVSQLAVPAVSQALNLATHPQSRQVADLLCIHLDIPVVNQVDNPQDNPQ